MLALESLDASTMKLPAGVLLFSALIVSSGLFQASGHYYPLTPPRGWNSYDSFSWIVDEEAFLDNARVVSSKLLPFGYEYVVIDYLWYRKNVEEASSDPYGYDNLDEWGRLVPDPDRWPSSRYGKGFKEVARKVHDMGLKFGIHLMGGISLEAVNSKRIVLDAKGLPYEEDGRTWHAGEIGQRDRPCKWMKNGFLSVNTDLGAGRAFLRSLYQQYADWDVDFVKIDCIFGDDLDKEQIITVSEILESLGRPILISLSPGTNVTVSMANSISKYVDMYRITEDFWDNWNAIAAHFDVARDFAAAKKIGANGLHGNSWPDLDMLPLGWLTDPGVRQGPHRKCRLTLDEQRTLFTLWSMAKSPLMYGGDLRKLDDVTFNLITNPTLLEIDLHSQNNMEVDLHLWSLCDNGTIVHHYSDGKFRSWIATGATGEIYLSIFNLDRARTSISADVRDLGEVLGGGFLRKNSSCSCGEVWTGKDFGLVDGRVWTMIEGHGCAVFVFNCNL